MAIPDPLSEFETISRRRVVRRFASRAVVGGVVIATGRDLLSNNPAGATTGAMSFGVANDAGVDSTSLTSSSSAETLLLTNTGGHKALSCSADGTDVNQPTISASNTGTNAALFAVQATDTSGAAAVLAVTWGPGPAVAANTLHADGSGVETATSDGHGVAAHVYGSGRCIHAKIHDGSSTASAVYADSDGLGAAVEGYGRGGRGARFRGAKAQLQLVPTASATHPARGLAGDLYVDALKRLWFCKGALTWVQVA